MKSYIRYLGILIDSNLSWKFHIDYVCQKVSKTIGIIAKLRHFVPRHVLLTVYRSLILPYIRLMVSVRGVMLLKRIFINYWFSRREPLG